MPKLIIQIPCFNEERTLPITLEALPREVPGFDAVEILVVDDGSTDETQAVAREHLADHVVRLPRNKGLAYAFQAGIEACLARGADVIVNTDADNQYCAADIERLVSPIVRGQAEIVIGTRPIARIRRFSRLKRFLQKAGSYVVRVASATDVPDAPSGFRAFSADAAKQLTPIDDYTHTLDTIIQAGRKRLAVVHVPVRVNEALRPSRLFRTSGDYIWRTLPTILRGLVTLHPYPVFAIPGAVTFLMGAALVMRFFYYHLTQPNAGHVQSVVLGALLLGTGSFLVIIGLLADLVTGNRRLIEKLSYRMYGVEDLLRRPPEDSEAAESRSHEEPVSRSMPPDRRAEERVPAPLWDVHGRS